jgi:hypothetical protein
MFRFTIRDVLWLTAVVALLSAAAAHANGSEPSVQDVHGEIVWSGEPLASLVDAKCVPANGGGLRWAVVYVKPDESRNEERSPRAARSVRFRYDGRFQPFVLAAEPDVTISVFNNDKVPLVVKASGAELFAAEVLHPTEQARFHVAATDGGQVKLEDVVTGKSAWLYVSPSPYWAVTDDKGSFHIRSVPIGRRTLYLWHPLMSFAEYGSDSRLTVEVSGGRDVNLDTIVLKRMH